MNLYELNHGSQTEKQYKEEYHLLQFQNLNKLYRKLIFRSFFTDTSPSRDIFFTPTHFIVSLLSQVLRMSQSKLAKITSGYVINLVSNDIQRLDLATQNLFASLRSPFDLVILGILLWVLIGWQAVTGLAFALILIPYEAEMTGWVAKLRMQAARVTDKRLGVMNEIVSGIRAVKMYAWELPYRDAVRAIRR